MSKLAEVYMKTFRDIFIAKDADERDKIVNQQTPWFMSEVKQYLSNVPKDGPLHISLTFKSLKTELVKVDQEFIFVNGKVSSLTETMTTGKAGAEKIIERAFINVNDSLVEEKDLRRILESANHARKEHHQPNQNEIVTQRTKNVSAKLADPNVSIEQKRDLLMVLAIEPPAVENSTACVEKRVSVVQTKAREVLKSQSLSMDDISKIVEAVNSCKIGVESADYEFAKINHTKELLNTAERSPSKPATTALPNNVVAFPVQPQKEKEITKTNEPATVTHLPTSKKTTPSLENDCPEVN